MTLLLVTGAGASRNLGLEDSPMPLMSDWSDVLCTALDQQEANLASACHLTPGMDGPEFEENLGLLLRWQQVRHLEQRFQDLGGNQAGSHLEQMERARQNINRRMGIVMETVNATLYQQFGQDRVDDDLARAAYGGLLRELGNPDLIMATTNYDRSGESALAALGHQVDAGFRAQPHRTPLLEPAGLVSERDGKTPVIHLHGAVGWYEKDGAVAEMHADLPYNPSLGTPVVLYPDPDKDPTSDATVSQLWIEFDAAVDVAETILVIGHSLHDPALVRALNRLNGKKPIVVSYVDGDPEDIVRSIPRSTPVELRFGATTEVDKPLLKLLHLSSEKVA